MLRTYSDTTELQPCSWMQEIIYGLLYLRSSSVNQLALALFRLACQRTLTFINFTPSSRGSSVMVPNLKKLVKRFSVILAKLALVYMFDFLYFADNVRGNINANNNAFYQLVSHENKQKKSPPTTLHLRMPTQETTGVPLRCCLFILQ